MDWMLTGKLGSSLSFLSICMDHCRDDNFDLSLYSPKATRLFGNNTVPVLATLFLVSYVKLLRTIVTALGFAILDYPEGARIVWLFDGNVSYFGLSHSFLFVVASFALLVFWFPYTATLLLVPCLRKKADHYLLRWVNKWKPFYDAYYAPLMLNTSTGLEEHYSFVLFLL